MAKSISRLQSTTGNDEDSIRQIRSNNDKIIFTGDSTNGRADLSGSELTKTDSDNVDYGDTDNNTLGTKGAGWTIAADVPGDGSDQTNPFKINFAEVT